jgi:hypothetical protein
MQVLKTQKSDLRDKIARTRIIMQVLKTRKSDSRDKMPALE